MARKPLQGTVASNVLQWGTGAINVDGCRVGHDEPIKPMRAQARGDLVYGQSGRHEPTTELKPNGRWPANVAHDGSDEVLRLFPNGTGAAGAKDNRGKHHGIFDGRPGVRSDNWGAPRDERGSAARFFYCAKASKADRDEGLPDGQHSNHPTVKPTSLMRWLVRLVTPPGGVILDPFCGSGSTGKAAMLEGFRFVGIEQDAEYCAIARARIGAAVADKTFGLFDMPEHAQAAD